MNRSMIPAHVKAQLFKRVARLITRLLDPQVLKGFPADFTEHEVMDMCVLMPDIFVAESPLLQLQSDDSFLVVGDIFGQYGHLVRLFNHYGHPPNQKYLFLGNYINNGPRSIETITLLFAYKVSHPKCIYLLRGKHECARMAKHYGFYEECKKRFSRRLWNAIVQVFSYLPAAALVDDRVFCVHSGLSPTFNQFDVSSIKAMRKFIRRSITLPCEIGVNHLLTHFVWSDPDETIENWDQNPAGLGYLYGPNAIEDFCKRFDLVQIIRSSEMVQGGFEFFATAKLLTIFSAPDYREHYANNGCMVHLHKPYGESEVRGQLNIISPIIRLRCRPTLRMNITLASLPIALGQGVLDDGVLLEDDEQT